MNMDSFIEENFIKSIVTLTVYIKIHVCQIQYYWEIVRLVFTVATNNTVIKLLLEDNKNHSNLA